MIREFKEETGLQINQWNNFSRLYNENYDLEVFYSVVEAHQLNDVQSMEEEQVDVYEVDEILLSNGIIENLRWMIPLAYYDNFYCTNLNNKVELKTL